MRVFKPRQLYVAHRTIDIARTFSWSITAMALVRLGPERVIYSEQELWTQAEPQVAGRLFDEGFAKPVGEVLCFGSCFPADGQPATAVEARITVADVDKRLVVVGDREWRGGVATAPSPFTTMPVDWAHAFGGEGHSENPRGKGLAPIGGAHALPNVELPDHLVRSPGDRPAPAGFGPIDVDHPIRAVHRGTYGYRWEQKEYPGYASDINPAYFNMALHDQRLKTVLKGDELVRVENMNATTPTLEGRLPGLRCRIFASLRTPSGALFQEVPTNLETLVLFPNIACMALIFRGTVPVTEDDADDVAYVVAGLEDLGQPCSEQHYREQLDKRIDRRAAARLGGRGLAPEWLPSGALSAPLPGTDAEAVARERLLEKNLRRRMQRELDEARAQMKAEGMDPDARGVPVKIPPMAEDLPVDAAKDPLGDAEQEIETLQAQAQQRMKDNVEAARKACVEAGVSFEAKVEAGRVGGPPTFRADDVLESVRDNATFWSNVGKPDSENLSLLRLQDPSLEPELRATEAMLLHAYRSLAHHFPAAATLGGEESERLRQLALEDAAAGRSFAGRDFTGADLSGMDFRGADFREALMERADLRGANVEGANFERAVLTRGDLEGAKAAGARFSGANLGEARLTGLDLSGADLERAILYKANLGGANLTRANLSFVDLTEASLAQTVLEGANLRSVELRETRIDGARFSGADMSAAIFQDADLSGLDFSRAILDGASFLDCRGVRTSFRDASLKNTRFCVVKMSTCFDGADFTGAVLAHACLRDVELRKAEFTGANLDDIDMSGAKLEQANLRGVVARQSMWIRANLSGADLTGANLMEAILKNANLRSTRLRGANLFRANLIRILVDGATDIADAEVTHIAYVEDKRS